MDENNFVYKPLNYTHDKIQELLKKVEELQDYFLTEEQYNKLINEIGLDNISTFDGNYYSLEMLPIIPSRTSQLINNTTYQTEKDIIEYDEQKIQPLRDDIELLEMYINKINQLDLDIALNRLEDIKYEKIFVNDYTNLIKSIVKDIGEKSVKSSKQNNVQLRFADLKRHFNK